MLKSGKKTVETRALNPDEPERYFGNVKVGDQIELKSVDTGECIIKRVKRVSIYYDFDQYLECEDFTKIFGAPTTKEAVKAKHFSFPGYEERLKKHGIVAFEIE